VQSGNPQKKAARTCAQLPVAARVRMQDDHAPYDGSDCGKSGPAVGAISNMRDLAGATS
jgi:hypothetical protein